MKILWMKPILPYPPTQGTRRVTLQLLQNLAPSHRIRLFTRLLSSGERREASRLAEAVPGLEVQARLAPNRVSALHRAFYRFRVRNELARGVPPVEAYTALPSLVRDFEEVARSFSPDLVVVEYWYSFPYLRAAGRRPCVLLAHDVEHRARARVPEGRSGFHVEASRDRAWAPVERERERAALGGAPFVWFLTEADLGLAVEDAGVDPARAAVVPYGLDLGGSLAPRREGDPDESPESVLLFGSYAADFNRDALAFTLDAVWPEIRERRPEARLLVAGGGLPSGLAGKARALGAEVRGEVADVRRLLLGSSVVLVPLRYGGGLRIRLLESLALGRAVVGTPTGVLGMGPRDGVEVLAAETPADLARHVVRALADSELRLRLGAAGRRWVETHHDPEAAGRAHRDLVLRSRTVQQPGDAG